MLRISKGNLLPLLFSLSLPLHSFLLLPSHFLTNTAYVSVSDALYTGLTALKNDGVEYLIIDQSGNRGGYINAGAIALWSLFPNGKLESHGTLRAAFTGCWLSMASWSCSLIVDGRHRSVQVPAYLDDHGHSPTWSTRHAVTISPQRLLLSLSAEESSCD